MNQIYFPAKDSPALSWSWATLIGPDAKDFLHRLTTVHVKALKVGEGMNGCFLTSQGKLRAYFYLWHFGPDEYAFEFDAGNNQLWKTELFSTIDQFTFGEKMALTDITAMDCCWIFPDLRDLSRLSNPILKAGQTVAIEEEVRLCHHGALDFGRPWITAWGRPARLAQWIEQVWSDAKQLDSTQLEAWRMDSIRPRTDLELTQNVMPLEIGLRDAIADNKGCYPGQEVIEKIIALGSPPKRLVNISGQGSPPKVGSTIVNLAEPPVEVGQVTSCLPTETGFTALGLVKKIHAKERLEVRFSDSPGSEGVIVKIAPYA
jgi:folate-binding protein YgfZ